MPAGFQVTESAPKPRGGLCFTGEKSLLIFILLISHSLKAFRSLEFFISWVRILVFPSGPYASLPALHRSSLILPCCQIKLCTLARPGPSLPTEQYLSYRPTTSATLFPLVNSQEHFALPGAELCLRDKEEGQACSTRGPLRQVLSSLPPDLGQGQSIQGPAGAPASTHTDRTEETEFLFDRTLTNNLPLKSHHTDTNFTFCPVGFNFPSLE